MKAYTFIIDSAFIKDCGVNLEANENFYTFFYNTNKLNECINVLKAKDDVKSKFLVSVFNGLKEIQLYNFSLPISLKNLKYMNVAFRSEEKMYEFLFGVCKFGDYVNMPFFNDAVSIVEVDASTYDTGLTKDLIVFYNEDIMTIKKLKFNNDFMTKKNKVDEIFDIDLLKNEKPNNYIKFKYYKDFIDNVEDIENF